MKALRNIFDVVSSSSEKMETWAEEHQYLTRYYDLKEVLLQQIVNELNYCCFTIGENLYSILSGDDVVSTRVFELAQQFSIDLEQLKTRIIQIHNETAKNKQAVYLYLTTLEIHTLKAKAKLMMMLQGERDFYQVQFVTSSQSSFVQR